MTDISRSAAVVTGYPSSTVQVECPTCKQCLAVCPSPVSTPVPEAESLYGTGRIHRYWWISVVAAAAIACVVTVFALGAYFGDLAVAATGVSTRLDFRSWGPRESLAACWAFWVLAPPIWFAFEYFVLFKHTPGSFAALKYGQEQATKAWAAVVVVLASILLGLPK